MSQQARAMRSKRQRLAQPGGAHDRLVRILAVALPAAIGVVLALMVLTPLTPRGEISFLLDRNKVAIAENRFAVSEALYRGEDDRGRPFSLKAGSAFQRVSTEPVVRLDDLTARILLNNGPASLEAPQGRFDFDQQLVDIDGMVRFRAADGYALSARNVAIDLTRRLIVGSGGVSGAVPAGTFSAASIRADLEDRTVTLQGNARLRMVPGQLRMP